MAFRPASGVFLACACALAVMTPSARADQPAEALPFPMLASQGAPAEGMRWLPDPGLLSVLAGMRAVTLVDVPLPGSEPATLELQRVDVASAHSILAINGTARPQAALDDGLSLWAGHVAGDAASDVFLAFSQAGSRGWIRRGPQLLHLIAQPDALGSWSAGGSRWFSEEQLREAGAVPPGACQSAEIMQPFATDLPRLQSANPADSGPMPLLEARIALETDYQFFQLFNDLDAARTYALTLFGAIGARYREQIGVIITLPYLGLYTSNNDPWFNQDVGGSSIDVLYEFRDAWGTGFGGAPPVEATVYHLISGASLGGGVAYLGALCNADYGFGVTGNLGGITPFPIVPAGALNWDFVATAHEIGHNFNADHTHNYCPPLDECAPPGYFGGCQFSQNCTTQGTIMSYCHLCSGGFANETTYFHPLSVADMRAAALSSCMPLFEGVLASNLGFAKSGSNGLPTLEVSYEASNNTLTFDVSHAPPGKPGTLFISLSQALLPFKGGTLVPAPELMLGAASTAAGTVTLPLIVNFSFPDGVPLVMQAWFKDTAGTVAATNGVLAELFIP